MYTLLLCIDVEYPVIQHLQYMPIQHTSHKEQPRKGKARGEGERERELLMMRLSRSVRTEGEQE